LGKLKIRSIFALLLFATLVTSSYYLFIYIPKHCKAGEPVLALAGYFLTYSPIQALNQAAYVVPDSLAVWDTPAEIRDQVCTLESGDKVQAVGHFRVWTHVRTCNGQDGWVDKAGLMDSATHEAEDRLLSAMSEVPVQARGHAADVDNVHIAPSRGAAVVAEVNPDEELEIFGRRVLQRSQENSAPEIMTVSLSHLEVWYLVREGSHAGWILGRRVELDIPKNISSYAQDSNLVAWLTLNTVADNGREIPQYLVADRAGDETCDFTHIRVLTWWKSKQTYAIAYREGGVQGYFPILVTHAGSVPYFRLRLVNDEGAKCQKLYGLFETITRVIGIADTWQSGAMPESRAFQIRTRRVSLTSSSRR
jgi:hypothetical protein